MLSLSASEQQAYDLEKAKTIEYLDAALASAKPRDGYRNALEKVNALRLICELGCYRKENKFKTLAPQNGRARSRSAPGTPVGPLTPMTPTEEDEDNDTGLDTDLAWRLEQCFPSCSDSKRNGFLASSRGQPRTESIGTIPPHLLPTKVRALLVDLQQCKEGTKRSTILDVTAAALNDAGISWVQIDGRYVLDIQDGKRDLTTLLLNAKTNTDGQVMGKLKSSTCMQSSSREFDSWISATMLINVSNALRKLMAMKYIHSNAKSASIRPYVHMKELLLLVIYQTGLLIF
ncbi:uncharacterized protein LY79DRAFT_575030 [Colletotrichum navitas]|uniref:Uncharacterized protein n=1 Tax=Colletotrichum navitas TaxID=681940 RepID=A0AAD8VBP7_9PEZI|nr:uncharacterized protein LY79DRAFT_575030 [Colletotrichum navitas]KAK1599298.1 hypothetical protein LY79DRAFT_575030 [Colletotrichum navitas]